MIMGGMGFLGRGASMNEIDLSVGNDINTRGRGNAEEPLKDINDPFGLLMSQPIHAKDVSSGSGDGTPRSSGRRKRKGSKSGRKHNKSEDEDS